MDSTNSRWEVFGGVVRNLVSALRDSVLFLLFLLLLLTPDTLRNRLENAGFTKGSIAGFEWQTTLESTAAQTKTIGQTVEQANEDYQTLIARLHALETQIQDPGLRDTVKGIEQEAEASRQSLTHADRVIRQSLSTQQQLVKKITPSAVIETGWIYIGWTTEDKKQWANGSRFTTDASSPQLARGTTLTITDQVYLHEDGPALGRAKAKILGVFDRGDTVRVMNWDYSHAKKGGWFLWANVVRI